MKYFVNHVEILLTVITTLLLSACTHIDNIPDISLRSPNSIYTVSNKVDLTVNLTLTEELKTVKWEKQVSGGGKFITPIGNQIAKNSAELSEILFKKVLITSSAMNSINPESTNAIEAFLTPRVVAIDKSVGATAFGEAIFTIALEWLLQDTQGNIIWVDTINGEGRSSSGNLFTAKSNSEEQIRMLLSDLFSKSFMAISTSPEISQFATRKFEQRPNLEHKPDEPKSAGTLPYGAQTLSGQVTGESASSLSASQSNQSSEALSSIGMRTFKGDAQDKISEKETNTTVGYLQNITTNRFMPGLKCKLAILPIYSEPLINMPTRNMYNAKDREMLLASSFGKVLTNRSDIETTYSYYPFSDISTVKNIPENILSEASKNDLYIQNLSNYKSPNLNIATDIGKKLKVDYVFMGTITHSNKAVLFLVDVNGKTVGKEIYEFQVPTQLSDISERFFRNYKSLLFE